MMKWQWAKGAATVAMMGGLLVGTTNGIASAAGNSLPTGQTITVWAWRGGPEFAAMKQLAQVWAQKHGDKVVVVDQTGNTQGFQFFATAARSGKGPDVVFGMPHDNNGTFQQEGLMLPVPKGTVNPSLYTKSELDASTIGGQLYSIPVSVQTTAIFYNKKLVPTPPKNWSQFLSDAKKSGFMYDQANLYFTYAFIGGLGGYVFKNNNGTLDPNNIGLGNAGADAAYKLLYDFNHKYKFMTPSTTGAVAKAKFVAGKLGMYISGPWDIPDFQKAKLSYSVTPLPTLSNGKPATPFMGVITSFVSAKTDPSKAAADWSLTQYLSGAEAQREYWNATQEIPMLVSLQKSKDIQSNPYVKAFSDQVKFAVPMPNIPQMQAVWTAMSILTNIISGKVSPQVGGQDFVNNVKKGIAAQG